MWSPTCSSRRKAATPSAEPWPECRSGQANFWRLQPGPRAPSFADMKKHGLASPPPHAWTRVEDYVLPLIRRAHARRLMKPRTQPEAPRLLLSTVPFLALLAALAVLAVAILIAARPRARLR